MARITVEDCIDKFPSRFELVLVASNRARKLHSGENPTVEKDNDKNTVIALREIADQTLTMDQLKNDLVEEYQTVSFNEEDELKEITDIENESISDKDEVDNPNIQDEQQLLDNEKNETDILVSEEQDVDNVSKETNDSTIEDQDIQQQEIQNN